MAITNNYISKIDYLKTLEKGWDYGYGEPISLTFIYQALKYLNFINKLDINLFIEIIPNTNGSLVIIFSKDNFDEFVDVTVGNYDQCYICHEKGIGQNYSVLSEKEYVHYDEIENKLKEVFV